MKTFMILSVFGVSVFSFTHFHTVKKTEHANIIVASAQQEKEITFPELKRPPEPDGEKKT